jgi:hypothetical protein
MLIISFTAVALTCVMFFLIKAIENNRVPSPTALNDEADKVALAILSAYRLEENQTWTPDGMMVRFRTEVPNPFVPSRKIIAKVAVSMHLTTVFFHFFTRPSRQESLWLAMIASSLSQKGASVAWPKYERNQPSLAFLKIMEYEPSK